jgi:putative OPT family oligopeptide transporter
MTDKSYIPADVYLPEITLRVIILAVLLSLVLAVSNAYLALKIGMLTSASIPAAIISMGILRFFKHSNILENNLVQTAASAGEAVAGGIVYTIPALIIIQYWTEFSYWQNFFIALTGGILGVIFSIPLRRMLMHNKKLPFPEGRAIAELLKISDYQKLGIRDILMGGLLGAALEFLQTGVKLLASLWEVWIKPASMVAGFGLGFSPALIGAGYLIGAELSISIFIGAVIGWLILIPAFSLLYPEFMLAHQEASAIAHEIWSSKIRYAGIGAMLAAGLLTLAGLLKPFLQGIKLTRSALTELREPDERKRTEKDIPFLYGFILAALFIVILYFLYQNFFPGEMLNVSAGWTHTIFTSVFIYTLAAGFIFCAITAYLSGMVGVSASPGSAIIIASLLIVAFLLYLIMKMSGNMILSPQQIKACEAVVIICTAVITGMAAISNDNMQDLKVGHLLGSTPWKQQVMLMIGVLCASLIVAPVMQLLFDVYGIAGVMPHPHMDITSSLPAPTAAVMATLSEAVFQQTIPWNMLFLGAFISLLFFCLPFFMRFRGISFSVLGIAMGVYLPLSSSMSLFLGGLIAWKIQGKKRSVHRDTILACGLIAGSAVMDVILAIPFSLLHNPDAMNLAPGFWEPLGILLSLIATAGLYFWFKRLA